MFEYEGDQYTLADLKQSAAEQGYDNFDEFMQMYVNNGMRQISDVSSQQPFGQEDKLKYYGGTSELAYYEDEGFFGETIDREIVNIGARGVNSFIKAIKGIGGYSVSLEIAASDWYGKNIKNETEEEKNLRQEQIRINQQNNIYKETFDPIVEGLEKAYIQSDKGVTEQFNAGNYGAMSRQIVSGGVESIPSLVAAYSGVGGLAALAASVGGEKFEQEFEREPEKSSAQLLLNATGAGVIEAGFELVTRGIMKKAGILKGNNQTQQAKEVIEEGSKAIAIAMGVGGEALSESSTQVASLLWDSMSEEYGGLGRKIDWPKAKYEIFDAGIIGGFVGGNITSFGEYTKSTPEAKQRAINILTHPTVNKKIKEHAENINKLIGNLAEASPEGKKLIQKEINKEYLEIQGLRNRSEQGLLNLNKEELQQYAKNIEESVKLGGIINSKTESLEAKNIAKKQNEALVKSNLAMLDVSSERTLEANLAIAKDADAKLGLEQVIIETDAEFAALPQGESGADGFIADGKVYINREIASKLASVSVGSHELLHGVTAGHLLGSDGLVTKQGIEFIDDMRNRMSSKERAIVEKRIEDNYKYERDKDGEKTRTKDKNEYYDEYLNVFHDAIVKKQITYNPTIEKIGQVFSKMFRTKGFDNIKFNNGKDVYNFVKTYSKDILKGKVSKETIAFAKPTTSDVSKKSVSKDQTNSVNELAEMGWTNETWKESGADFAIKEMQANKMLDGLIRSKYKADVVPDNFVGLVYSELVNHVKNFKPEQNDNLFGWINSQIANKAGNVYNREFKVADEMKGAKDIGKTTKEGEVKVQVAAEKSAEMEAFEEEDLSIQGQAKKAKADKQQYSEYRRKLGFETGSKIYNEVLDNVKKSLMMAYGATQNITDAQLRAQAIAAKLKKEYANLNSPLFKQIKNFLTYGVADTYVKRGTKDIYISNLKKFREDIVKNTSTADLVQMERNTPEADRIFTNFVKTLTSIEQVQDAVNKEQLPPDALNKITKDKKTGKGAFSPSLYNKIMPTETELISWADQPGINPVTGARQGLKGTRKDGLAMRMVNGLVTDAIMEARQSEEVQNKIANMDIDPGSVAELGAAIGREVNVKFSKSNAIGDVTAAINGAGDVSVYSQIKFSKSHREAYEKQLTKRRPDLTEDQRKNAVQSVFDFVDGKEIPNHKKSKYEKMAMHYTANGYLILPEDGYKVIEAEKIATQKKLDPFSFKNPNVLIETYVGEVKGTRTNPDNVKTFTNKTEFTNGVTVYNVEDSRQGQKDVRKVIDTHFGEKSNPWCLCARRGEYYSSDEAHSESEMLEMKKDHESLGRTVTVTTYKSKGGTTYDGINIKKGQTIWELTIQDAFEKGKELEAAFKLWKDYNKEGNGHQIAFQNGRLVAFRDGKKEPQWWDRNDKPTTGVVVRGKKVDGFKEVIEVDKTKETLLYYEKVLGDKKNGTTIKKDLKGNVFSLETKKNGLLYGESLEVKDDPEATYTNTRVFDKKGEQVSLRQEVAYKDKNSTFGTSFGKDGIRLDNITKYERFYTNPVMEDMDGGGRENVKDYTETVTVEGTINQKYFKEFNDPSSADGFTKTNLPYLTPANERYYGRQGEKVTLVTKEDGKPKDKIVTINGVEQDIRVQFSKSNVKFSLTSRREFILLPSYVNKKIKALKEKENITAAENQVLDILEVAQGLYDMEAVEVYNTLVEQFPSIFNNLQESDFKNQKSFIAALERNNQTQMKVNGYITSKKVLQKQTENLSIEKGVELIAEYLTNVGRDVRSALIVKTNKGLKVDLINTLQNGRFKKYFKAEETFKGSGKYKIVYAKDGKNFENVEIYESVENIKNNIRKDKSLVKTVNEQAEKSQEYRLKTLDPNNKDLTLGDKLDFIELTNTGTKGSGRKAAKIDVTVTDKSNLIAEELVLEHEITIKNMKSYERAYAKGDISKEQMKEVYQQNKVHVLPKSYKSIFKKLNAETGKIKPLSKGALILKKLGIKQGVDDVLVLTGKASQRQGMGYESITELSSYFESLFNNGLINKMPESLQDSFNRKSNSFKNAVQFSRSANNPTKGITVLDFDDTLATSKSLIRFTRPDGTKGTLNAEQYASTYQELTELGYQWDFSEFNKVVDGKTAPLFNKAMKLQGKFGPENMFVLTARPAESAAAIHAFLKANGLNIPLKNITGLANSTAEAKALWMAEKVGEGYNDFYFADDALQNVKAVQNMLNQFDVKSKVQQARVKFSKNMDTEFNNILENVTGIESKKRFSIIKGRKRGESKGKFRYFVPPSHEDFVGLLYNFMGRGKEGNKHRDFLEQALVRPLNRANRELDTARQSVANDYKALNKQFILVKEKLTKKTPDGDFVFQDAIRVYLWDKHGHKIPGLSETDQTKLAELVMSDPQLQAYAETLNIISKQENYVAPTDGWNSGDIRMDLDDATGRIGRGQHFAEFIENADIIFSEENLNKIEAGYGESVRESLEDILYRIKTGRNRPSGQNKQVNNLMNYLNGSVGTVMFFNMRSALLQQMSIVNYINFADNNIFAAAKAFANQKQYWADWSFIFNSDMLKQRRGGIQTDVNGAELAASLRNSKNISRKLISKLLELGFLPTQIGDNIAIATGGAAYYRNRINTYLKQGLSQKEAEAKAFTDFQDITQSTQQSARPDMVSKQQASVIGKVILNFQNVTSQFNRLGKKAFQDIYNRRITKPNTTQMQSDISNASRITYYFAVQNAIFYTLQTALFAMMFDDDEEDNNNLFLKKRERLINGSIDSVLRGSGLIGGVVATLKNVAIAFARQRDVKYNPDESAVGLEALNLSPVLGIKLRKIVNAEKTLNYNKSVIKEMETFDIDNPQWSAATNYTEAFTNIPLNRLYNKTQNVRQSLNNDHAAWERTLMFLGWSQYNLDLENKKMEDIKSDIKEKKKQEKKKSKKKKGKGGLTKLPISF